MIKDVGGLSVVGGGGGGGGNDGGIWDFRGDDGGFVFDPKLVIRNGVTRNKSVNLIPGSGVERIGNVVNCNKALVAVIDDAVGNE
jgi:hypothetical protein